PPFHHAPRPMECEVGWAGTCHNAVLQARRDRLDQRMACRLVRYPMHRELQKAPGRAGAASRRMYLAGGWSRQTTIPRHKSGKARIASETAIAPCAPGLGETAWTGRRRPRFRTFQVCPKDLGALPGHPEPAVSWHSGFRGGAHARHKTTPVYHAARRRGCGVAVRGARAATRRDASHRTSECVRGERSRRAGLDQGVDTAPARIRLDQWTQRSGRVSFCRRGRSAHFHAASELIELRPDVVLASGALAATALRQQTLSIPIVFVQVVDPVSAGFVTNLARPEGNITGFTNFEFSVGGKWLQLLKECAPSVDRIAVVFDPANPTWAAYLRTIEAAAPSFGVRLIPAGVRDAAEITQRVATFARDPNGGLVVLPSPVTIRNRETIIVAAARHRLP